MANLKISQLPTAGTIDGTELLSLVQAGVNVKTNLTTALGSATSSIVATVLSEIGQQVVNVAAVRALAVPATAVSIDVEGYTTPGDFGGGTFIWSVTSLAQDESVIIFKPNTLTQAQPGRWIRQLTGGIITPEMAGGCGDYIFPQQAWVASTSYWAPGLIQNGSNVYYCSTAGTSASSGGPSGTGQAIIDGTCIWQYKGAADSGTNNSPAFLNLIYALTFTTNNGLNGGTIRLMPGRSYLFSTDYSLVSEVAIEGLGVMSTQMTATFPFTAIDTSGSNLVIDPSITFSLNSSNSLKNLRIVRRGLLSSPTTAQVDSFWAACANELSPGMLWAPITAYTSGAIVANMGNVYKCDTSGTSDVFGSGGPLPTTTGTNSITDGTAKWHFLNQLPWLGNTAYVVGTIITNGCHVYICDTAGTSQNIGPGGAIFGPGPSGTNTTVNSIVDGTAKWHNIGKISVGVFADMLCKFEDLVVVGFAKGILLPRGCEKIDNVYMDNIINLDVSGCGDTIVAENVHCIPLYAPQDNPGNSNWIRKQSPAIHIHDDVDTAVLRDCESELWAVGIRTSNVWGTTITDCRVETDFRVWGDAAYQSLNVASYVEFNNNYALGVIAYDIQNTDFAHAPSPCIRANGQTYITIHGGQCASFLKGGGGPYTGTGTPTHFQVTGNAFGTISDMSINMQDMTPFTFLPWSNTNTFWNIQNIRIDEDTTLTYAKMAAIDSTMVPYVHFAGMWDAAANRWVVPPGHDDSTVVASPTTGFSNTIPPSCSRYILTPSGTLATGTVIMPVSAFPNQVITIMTNHTITGFTLSPGSGQTISGAPTTLVINTAVKFVYVGTVWYREI